MNRVLVEFLFVFFSLSTLLTEWDPFRAGTPKVNLHQKLTGRFRFVFFSSPFFTPFTVRFLQHTLTQHARQKKSNSNALLYFITVFSRVVRPAIP